jgi:tetratricopeptide (TPR) repeat protein
VIRVLVALLVLVLVAPAIADPEADADRAFRTAMQRAASGEVAQAIEQFEALGAARPITRWTDDAWAEAGRLAERTGDLARARRAYQQVIAVGDELASTAIEGNGAGATSHPSSWRDVALVRRARAALARLSQATGGGRWDAVKREHDRLASRVFGSAGDPRGDLHELEALARANPEYPQVTGVWLAIAHGWEREGDGDRALELLGSLQRDASSGNGFGPRTGHDSARSRTAADRQRIGFAFVRIAIRRGALAAARERLDALAAVAGADRYTIGELRERLAIAEQRAWLRRLVWIALAVLGMLAAAVLRRDAGSWRAAGKALARPPIEVLFLLPIGAVMVAVAQTGNPLVAGLAIGWLSGAVLDVRRARAGRIGAARAIGQAVIAAAAIAGATYLAVDRDRMLDLVAETIEHGPSH